MISLPCSSHSSVTVQHMNQILCVVFYFTGSWSEWGGADIDSLRVVSALDGEVPIWDVLLRQRLITLARYPLLLQLQVAQHRHQHNKHNETHAAAHDEPEAPCEDGATLGKPLTNHRCLQCSHLCASCGGWVTQKRVGCVTTGCPVTKPHHTYEVAGVWWQLSQFHGAHAPLQQLATHLHRESEG